MKAVLCAIALLAAGCGGSPIAPSSTCQIPTGPLTFRVLFNTPAGPLAGQPAQLRAGSCLRDTTTNAAGIAEWHIPAGTYTVRMHGSDSFVDRLVANDTQWLVTFPQ